jgi:hypothetical protein
VQDLDRKEGRVGRIRVEKRDARSILKGKKCGIG